MRVPSNKEAQQCIEAMTTIGVVGRRLTPKERNGYRVVAGLVRSADLTPLNICEVHALLNPEREYAGIFRFGEEVAEGVARFYKTYTNALHSNLSDEIGQDSVIVDWFIGAFGRCLRPFVDGNAAVFYFVENHLLQVHDMKWRLKPIHHAIFLDFRDMGFNPAFRHLKTET